MHMTDFYLSDRPQVSHVYLLNFRRYQREISAIHPCDIWYMGFDAQINQMSVVLIALIRLWLGQLPRNLKKLDRTTPRESIFFLFFAGSWTRLFETFCSRSTPLCKAMFTGCMVSRKKKPSWKNIYLALRNLAGEVKILYWFTWSVLGKD